MVFRGGCSIRTSVVDLDVPIKNQPNI